MELSDYQKHVLEYVYPKINTTLYDSIEINNPKQTLFLDILLYIIPLVERLKVKIPLKIWSKRLKGIDKEMIVIGIGYKLIYESINKNYCNEFIKYADRNIKKIIKSFNMMSKK